MKKILSVLGLIAVLSMSTPAFAAPGGPGGPGGHGGGPGRHGGPGMHGGGHRIHAGAHHRPHMAPRHHHHGGVRIYTGHYPRHSYWYGYRGGYWGSPWCDYRLGWCDPYYYPGIGVHVPVGRASFSVRF